MNLTNLYTDRFPASCLWQVLRSAVQVIDDTNAPQQIWTPWLGDILKFYILVCHVLACVVKIFCLAPYEMSLTNFVHRSIHYKLSVQILTLRLLQEFMKWPRRKIWTLKKRKQYDFFCTSSFSFELNIKHNNGRPWKYYCTQLCISFVLNIYQFGIYICQMTLTNTLLGPG
jgi:hypothetical protein